ncbi:MAG: bifunctional [glutamate--ammonia ligase]-adenylyl-L-tyrosine phosphorylase/[glutamate--ammonia-ligase] adenylyltransferase [Pseudomonadota bacterium]
MSHDKPAAAPASDSGDLSSSASAAGSSAWSADEAAALGNLSQYAALQLNAGAARTVPLLELALPADSEPSAIARGVFGAAETQFSDDPMRALRAARHALHVAVLWREWLHGAAVEESFGRLSSAANEAICRAVHIAATQLKRKHGVIRDSDGRTIQLAVLAMGKLGGGELNFSSDIDLVFLYRSDGISDGPKPLSGAEYFTRWAREVVRLLDQRTADGFVYRVDVRLRPFGASGPLVVNYASFEAYLEQQGRDWERYAYLKARLVDAAADPDGDLAELLDRFVYRRYLDYGIFGSLRELKAKIEAEVQRRDRLDDIKLGPGGIREIEFIVQSLQLIRGGREPQLKQRHLPAALAALAAAGHIDEIAAGELGDAYRFLRRVENAVQGLGDEQTHRLPTRSADLARVVDALGYTDADEFERQLNRHRARVQRQFNASELGGEAAHPVEELAREWPLEASRLTASLTAAGVANADVLASNVESLLRTADAKRLDETSRARLDSVLPLLLEELCSASQPLMCWERLGPVLESVLRRSAYLALLIENRGARQRLVEWVGRSGFLATELAANPILLDELLGHGGAAALSRADLLASLQTQIATIDAGDTDRVLQRVAEFQRVSRFRIAIRDEAGEIPVMRVSDALTALAEAVVEVANAVAWQENLTRYGAPQKPDTSDGARFCVIGYGKLGGFELGYGSDLDIVFLHDSVSQTAATDGAKSIANDVFFARHVRKLIHYLTYQTAHGPMYEVDVRLRPSGRSGLLVTSLDAFERYQREQAWTWEHQALLRSRAVVGDPSLCEEFEAARTRLLCTAVKRATLAEDVANMRERMRRELSKSSGDEFDLKQDAGGIADIEFLVQYLVLRDAAEHPALLEFSDNMRQIDRIAETGRLGADDARELQAVYLAYREAQHHLSLTGQGTLLPVERYRAERDVVTRLWREVFTA